MAKMYYFFENSLAETIPGLKFEYEDKMTFRVFSSILVIFLEIKYQGQPFLHLNFFFTFVSIAGAQVVITV